MADGHRGILQLVRHAGGVYIGCFRPALVNNVKSAL